MRLNGSPDSVDGWHSRKLLEGRHSISRKVKCRLRWFGNLLPETSLLVMWMPAQLEVLGNNNNYPLEKRLLFQEIETEGYFDAQNGDGGR